MRSSRERALSATHEGFEEAALRDRDSPLAGEGRRRGRGAMRDSLRDRVLLEARTEAPGHGFSDAILARAGERTGAGKREMLDAFPNGAASLVEAFSHWADARMTEQMANDTSERVRERVRNAVKARIEAMT